MKFIQIILLVIQNAATRRNWDITDKFIWKITHCTKFTWLKMQQREVKKLMKSVLSVAIVADYMPWSIEEVLLGYSNTCCFHILPKFICDQLFCCIHFKLKIKNISSNPLTFKSKLKSFLMSHSFYSVEKNLKRKSNFWMTLLISFTSVHRIPKCFILFVTALLLQFHVMSCFMSIYTWSPIGSYGTW